MKKIVITGCAGFIGGHLSERILEFGCEVLGIDNMRSGLQSTMDMLNSSSNFKPLYLDISSPESFSELASSLKSFRPDVVFHLAAIPGVPNSVVDPVFTNQTNLSGTLNMLEASKEAHAKRFVFSSSSSVYGGADNLPTPETEALSPKSPYALQKKFSEEYCKIYSDIYNLDTVSLRYFNVFGPRQRSDSAYSAAIASFFNAREKNISPTIFGDGQQTRDFCYVSNVVDANILAAKASERLNGMAINIGAGENISIKNLVSKICDKTPIYQGVRAGDVMHSMADISLAKERLGYIPNVKCAEGISMMSALIDPTS